MISGDSQRQTGNFNVQRRAHISPLQFFIEHIFLDACNTCIFELRIKKAGDICLQLCHGENHGDDDEDGDVCFVQDQYA